MTILIIGLLGFIASHMIRVVADDWRGQVIANIGENRYKLLFSLVSLASLTAIIFGYAAARGDSLVLWAAPAFLYSATSLLMLVSMIMLAGFPIRRSHLSIWLRHPMLWSVVVFCGAHLLSNGRLVDGVLFGSLFVWSVIDLLSCYKRDRANPPAPTTPTIAATLLHIGLGIAFFVVFAIYLHEPLIGVSPIPGG